jgi:hypothetical protein
MSQGEPAGVPVDVRTRFDQFPATIKGAFVMRGADGNPHAVDLLESILGRVPAGESRPLSLGPLRVDVAPGRDLFVPFEVGIADLEPGWYAVHSTIRVDAGGTWSFLSKAFAIPWPKDQVRRGTVTVGRTVRSGRREFTIESVEMRGDCAVVAWRTERGEGQDQVRPALSLEADGTELEGLPPEARALSARSEAGGAGHSVFYPVPRRTSSLWLVVGPGHRSGTDRIQVSL